MPLLRELAPVRQYIPRRWRQCALGYMDQDDIEQIAAITIWLLEDAPVPNGYKREAYLQHRVHCALSLAYREARFGKRHQVPSSILRAQLAAAEVERQGCAPLDAVVSARELLHRAMPEEDAVLPMMIAGYSAKEIAQYLGVPLRVVESRQRRTRRRLHRLCS